MKTKQNSGRGMVLLITALLFAAQFAGNYGHYQLAAIPARVYEAFQLNDMQFSSLITAPMMPSIFLSIVIGLLVDRYGIPKIVGIWFLLAAAGFALRCFVGNYPLMLVSMALSGFGCMVVNANLAKIASSIYSMDKVSKVVGIIMGASSAATALSFATTAMIGSLKLTFLIPAAASAAIALLWLVFVREKSFSAYRAPEEEKNSVKQAFLLCLKNRSLWIAGLTEFLLLGASMIVTNFHVSALTAYQGYTESAAGSFNSVLMVGAIFGSVLLPVYVTRKPERAPVLVFLMLVISALTCYGLIALPEWGIYICAFLNGALRSGVIATMMMVPVLLKDIGPRNAGTAGGFILTLQLLGAVILPTYVIVPLGKGNLNSYFILASAAMLLSAVTALIFMKTCGAFGKTERESAG